MFSKYNGQNYQEFFQDKHQLKILSYLSDLDFFGRQVHIHFKKSLNMSKIYLCTIWNAHFESQIEVVHKRAMCIIEYLRNDSSVQN